MTATLRDFAGWSMASVIAALVALPAPAAAQSDPARTIDKGENLYFDGKYEEALFILEELSARPDLPKALRVRALKTIAYAYYLMKSPEQAKEAWTRLLQVDPTVKPSLEEVSPELVKFFSTIQPPATAKTSGKEPTPGPDKKAEPAKTGGDTGTPPPGQEPPAAATDERGCGIVLCLIPLGVGQFANDQIVKGIIFAALEPAFLVLNIVFWDVNLRNLNADGTCREGLCTYASQNYTLQMTFFGLTVGTALLGILDAFVFY